MDERLRYEQLIGGKLQSLPVPDMQDAIWARIKTQLDLDIPTDDGDGGSSPQSPSGPKIIGWGLSVVIIALITTFFLLKNKPARNNSAPPSTIEQSISPNTQSNSPPIQRDNTINKTSAPVSEGADDILNNAGNDSLVQQDPVTTIPFAADSTSANLPPPLVTIPSPQAADTTAMVKKKGRGMTGLNDSSYRIVPKNKN